MIKQTLVISAIILTSASCNILQDKTTTTTTTVESTFTSINTNVLQTSCMGCHAASTSSAGGGVLLDSYAEVLKYVTASDSANSSLYTEVNSGSMPQGGSKLADATISAIKTWIDNGAENN